MRIGDWTVTPTQNSIERDGVSVKLEPRAMDLLVYLARAGSRVVSPDELLRDVWHGRVFDDGVVYKKINQLRKALGDDSQQPRFIATIPKRGYRLVAPVVLEAAAPEPHEIGAWPPGVTSPRAHARWSSRALGRRFNIKLRPIAYLSGAVAALAAAFLTMTSRDDGTAAVATPSAAAPGPRIVPLTFDGGRKEQPRLSPDGELVAYTWNGPNGDDDFDIYVRPVGRGTPHRLTTDSADDIAPAWSPDGEKIAFVRLELDGLRASIHEVVFPGGGTRQIIELPAPPISGGGLSDRTFFGWLVWSPDGDSLLYGEPVAAGSPARIVRLDLETLEKSPITTPPATPGSAGDFGPSYSPDGRTIAFVRGGSGYANLDVWIMDADGQAARRLTTSQWSFIRGLGWSANGREVLFTAGNPFDARSYSVPISGGPPALLPGLGQGDWDVSTAGKRQVFAKFADRRFYTWEIPGRLADDPRTVAKRLRHGSNLVTSPRGDRIAWQSGLTGHPQIWIAAGDGSDERQLTDVRTVARVPQWSRSAPRTPATTISTALRSAAGVSTN